MTSQKLSSIRFSNLLVGTFHDRKSHGSLYVFVHGCVHDDTCWYASHFDEAINIIVFVYFDEVLCRV